MFLQRREQRPCQRPRLPLKTSRKGGLGKRTDGRRRGGSHNLRALHGGNSASYRMAVRRAGAAAMNPLLHRVGGRAGGAPPSGQVHQPPQFTAMGHPQVRGARHLTSLSPTSKHNKSHNNHLGGGGARTLCPRAAPGTMGAPLQTPCTTFPAGEPTSPPARPSTSASKRGNVHRR